MKEVALHNNQLTGTVPSFSGKRLEFLLLENNYLDSLSSDLGNIITWSSDSDKGCQVQWNRLTFDDILPNMRIAKNGGNWVYAPQRKIYKDTTFTRSEGESLTIDLGIDARY